jgi:hypothetical protein
MDILTVNRRNVAALTMVTALLAGAYFVYPHPIVQYGTWLVIFTIWMSWFVFTGIKWLAQADF